METELAHVGVVAERTQLSIRTLRHYDEIGLVTPSGRSHGGFRLYSEDDITRLMVIRRMKPLGFTLEEMAHVLGALFGPGPAGEVDRALIASIVADARGRRAALADRLAMADEFVELVEAFLPPGVGSSE